MSTDWSIDRDIALARADRAWRDTLVVTAVGPLHLPERARMVQAIEALARRYPESRLGWSLDGNHWRWRPNALGELAESMVSSVPPEADIAASLAKIAALPAERPIRFLYCGNHLVLAYLHAVGDGEVSNDFLTGVLTSAATGELVEWPSRPVAAPHLRTLTRTFVRSPRRARHAVRTLRAQKPAAVCSSSGLTSQLPWAPSPSVVVAAMNPVQQAELKAWRRAEGVDVSPAVLPLILGHRALAARGIAFEPSTTVLFSLRRYLPGVDIGGNFVAGVELPLTAGTSPAELDAMLTENTLSARPLATAAISLLRGAPARATSVDVDPVAHLAYSYLGKSREIERLPWVDRNTGRYSGFIDPGRPNGITLAMSVVGRRLNFNISFHGNVFAQSLLQDALDAIVGDPVSVLTGASYGVRSIA